MAGDGEESGDVQSSGSAEGLCDVQREGDVLIVYDDLPDDGERELAHLQIIRLGKVAAELFAHLLEMRYAGLISQ